MRQRRQAEQGPLEVGRCVLSRSVLLGALLLATTAGAASASAAAAKPPVPCTSGPAHQFDFWLGDWDAVEVGGSEKVAHAKIEPILDGCVVHEIYDGADGHRGESFSVYDAPRGVWHQTWVTNRGELLTIAGTFHDGQMELAGAFHLEGGREKLVRGVWKPASGGVRETAVTSLDGGKTWQPWFDLMFVPHRP